MPPKDECINEAASPQEAIKAAFHRDDAATVRQILGAHPEMKAHIDDPVGPFDSPAIMHVRSRAMLDALLEAGADIDARSRWWAGSFGLLDCAAPDLAVYAIGRGAKVTAHAAARLGMLDKLKELAASDPACVNSRGGDGQTPLHFASTVEIADYLLDRGAEIDLRDIDHESTPAQYMVDNRHAILRRLIERGCKTDLLMAAALGDIGLAAKHLAADPKCIYLCVSEDWFPKANPRSGGTIYQWKLGFYVSPHQVARQFGHGAFFEWLVERSPADARLMAACWGNDDAAAAKVVAEHPGVAANLSQAYKNNLAHAARNNNLAAVKLMLASGMPVDGHGQHGGTALHWAAWHGNAEAVRALLRHGPALEDARNDFRATPMNWAIHGSENGWHKETGDYGATVEALAAAGAKLPSEVEGSPAAREALRRLGVKD